MSRDEANKTEMKSIQQMAQDLSSDSDESHNDELDAKIHERRTRRLMKQGKAIQATPVRNDMTRLGSQSTGLTADVTISSSGEDSDISEHSEEKKDEQHMEQVKKQNITPLEQRASTNKPSGSFINLSSSDVSLAAHGLLSEHSIRRLSERTAEAPSEESDYSESDPEQIENERQERRGTIQEIRQAGLGLMGKRSMKNLATKVAMRKAKSELNEDTDTEGEDQLKQAHGDKLESDAEEHNMNCRVKKTFMSKVKAKEEEKTNEECIVTHEMKRMNPPVAERRSAYRGDWNHMSMPELKSSFNSDDIGLPSSSEDSPASAASSVDNIVQPQDNAPTNQKNRRFSEAELRSAKKGIISRKTLIAMKNQDFPNIAPQEEKKASIKARCLEGKLPMSKKSFLKHGNEAAFVQEPMDEEDESSVDAPSPVLRNSIKTRCALGQLPLSSRSLLKLENEAKELAQGLLHDEEDIEASIASNMHRCTSGELRSMSKGIASRSSMLNLRREGDEDYVGSKRRSSRRISFKEDIQTSDWQAQDTESKTSDMLIFSSHSLESDYDQEPEAHQDILREGQTYLGISMLVYMYSHLRETVRQGLTRVKMEDIDVHSCQSDYGSRRKIKYLSKTKTAGSIIRVVIDELDAEDENDADHELLSGEARDYEKSQTAQFRKWIEDSRVSQLDKETENIITELRKKVARHRWKRAISAVRLSYKLSGGKRPEFNAPVVAPGCENENRFVDLNEMMSEVVRKQPKYFKQGSIMDNLIESGIEVAWFSDLTQNDVVYGVCCQRDEKKVTVVFRGTVNSHNWSMNLKFDTNEYRNPIKVDYPGRADEISLHSGFALYLLRKRKDTGLSKMQEIFEKVDAIGREMAPNGKYKLCITGHSLGGALATLLGFYVAAKPKFSNLKTVYIWTYAAPRVGTKAFFHAYQYLERIGKIRHARFSNTNDIVPLIPFCNFEVKDLQFYQHVGMRVQLHSSGKIGKMRLRHALDVTYPLRHDWLSRLRRIFMNNIFANLTTIKRFGINHTPTEIQRRLLFASHYKQALASGAFFADQKRNKIKNLDEYYAIRANIKSHNISDAQCESLHYASSKSQRHGQKLWVHILVFFLLLSWLSYIATILGTESIFKYPLMPFTAFTGIVSSIASYFISMCNVHLAKLQGMLPVRKGTLHAPLFISKTALSNPSAGPTSVKDIAKNRALGVVRDAVLDAKTSYAVDINAKMRVIHYASSHIFNISSVIDGHTSYGSLTLSSTEIVAEESVPSAAVEEDMQPESEAAKSIPQQLILDIESKVHSLTEKATGISFESKLYDNLYLVGVGARKKSIISIYAVAMYASPLVIRALSRLPKRGSHDDARATLRDAARTFDALSHTTSFVLNMVYKVDAKTIATAIADGVKPRFNGIVANIEQLESLIFQGVESKGGYATKGTQLKFECSAEGVTVSVDNILQGKVDCNSLGGALVDVFMDDQAVSPTLIANCIDTWRQHEL